VMPAPIQRTPQNQHANAFIRSAKAKQ